MEKFARRCDATGKGINDGYVVEHFDILLHFESVDELLKHLKSLDWEDIDGNKSKDCESDDDLLEYFYNEEYYYYTEWDETDIDDCYYDAEGNEFNN